MPSDRRLDLNSLADNQAAFDDRELARRSRTTLAGADAGLLFAGVGIGCPPAPSAVQVVDDDGEALVGCRHDSPIARAAQSRCIAALVLAPTPTLGVRLRLSGRLSPIGRGTRQVQAENRLLMQARNTPLPASDMIVVLQVDRVEAGCPYPHPRALAAPGRLVPLELYAAARPDAFAANVPRMINYLNDHHAERLRWLASDISEVPLDRLAAAHLTALSPTTAGMRWIDETGTHDTTIAFTRPSNTLEELARAIRARIQTAAANLGR